MNLSPSPRTTSPIPTRNARRARHAAPGTDRPRRDAVSADAVVSAYVNEIARPLRRPMAAEVARPGADGISERFAQPVPPADLGGEGPAGWTRTPPQRRSLCIA